MIDSLCNRDKLIQHIHIMKFVLCKVVAEVSRGKELMFCTLCPQLDTQRHAFDRLCPNLFCCF